MQLLKEWKTLQEQYDACSTNEEYYSFLEANEKKILNLFELTYPEILKRNNGRITARGYADKKNPYDQEIKNPDRPGIINLDLDAATRTATFTVPGDHWPNSKSEYHVVVAFSKEGPSAEQLSQMEPSQRLKVLDVSVNCDCPFFQFNGPEYNAKANGYLYGAQNGTASTPDVRDPNREYYICKHIAAVFAIINNSFRLPGNWFRAAEKAPVAKQETPPEEPGL